MGGAGGDVRGGGDGGAEVGGGEGVGGAGGDVRGGGDGGGGDSGLDDSDDEQDSSARQPAGGGGEASAQPDSGPASGGMITIGMVGECMSLLSVGYDGQACIKSLLFPLCALVAGHNGRRPICMSYMYMYMQDFLNSIFIPPFPL